MSNFGRDISIEIAKFSENKMVIIGDTNVYWSKKVYLNCSIGSWVKFSRSFPTDKQKIYVSHCRNKQKQKEAYFVSSCTCALIVSHTPTAKMCAHCTIMSCVSLDFLYYFFKQNLDMFVTSKWKWIHRANVLAKENFEERFIRVSL